MRLEARDPQPAPQRLRSARPRADARPTTRCPQRYVVSRSAPDADHADEERGRASDAAASHERVKPAHEARVKARRPGDVDDARSCRQRTAASQTASISRRPSRRPSHHREHDNQRHGPTTIIQVADLPVRTRSCAQAPAQTTIDRDAAVQRAQGRLLRRRHRSAQPARRSQAQPVAQAPRGGHDVRQRRQLRACCATSSACCRPATC